jgi:hypothetical protein
VDRVERAYAPVRTYNLTVAGSHTFFADGVWVHNCATKPSWTHNPKHHKNARGKSSPEPDNARELFDSAIPSKDGGAWWAKDANGVFHRFSAASNGQSHWNGSTAGPNAIPMNQVPNLIQKALE